MGGKMKILGIKSICCGDGVKQNPQLLKNPRNYVLEKQLQDRIYICQKCKKECEGYFIAQF
jgi:hypothetical protein